MTDQPKKCAHPSCNCPVQKDSNYCGAYCEGQAHTADINCNCGHAGCVAAATV